MHQLKLGTLALFLLLSLCLIQIISADLHADKQALLTFASLIPHGRKLNWTSNSSVCSSWVGISCTANSSQPRVRMLRLPAVGLFGPLPGDPLGKLDALEVLSLRSNRLSANLPTNVSSLPSLQSLFLQHNNLSGIIPTKLSSSLRVLDLSYNTFSGVIPTAIGYLSQLTTLHLQNNSLSGTIPDVKLPKLRHLNLSYNNLSGPIPPSFSNFSVQSFLGNIFLCGTPLPPCAILAPPPLSPTKKNFWQKLGTWGIVGIAAGVAFLLVLMIALLICCLKRRRGAAQGDQPERKSAVSSRPDKSPKDTSSGLQGAERNKLVFFEGCSHNFDLEDLLRASAEVLGKGIYGTTYKAVLEDGTIVVVKRLKEVVASKRDFEQQMEIICRLGRHKNAVPLRAYYYSKDEKLLIFDYYSSGCLSAVLHGTRATRRTPLDWATRTKIALGAARALAHLHANGGARFIHGDIKSNNVLLLPGNEACLSEFGLAQLMAVPRLPPSLVGYRAPEVIETRKSTQKSDVYSFGVLLLELLTGKAPLRSPSRDDSTSVEHLPRWVQSVVREEWTAEVFDTDLMQYPNIEDELVQMLQLAMACVSTHPDQRPRMDEVVRRIEEIRGESPDNRTSSPEEVARDESI